MKFNLKRSVESLSKKGLKFLQPLFEAITNSLEAGASLINVNLYGENLITPELKPKIIGFSVEDNGIGFTELNRNSFNELWSDHKIELGCKGSGRFTWLNVFNNITINSYICSEQVLVHIPFNLDYDEDKINISLATNNIVDNKTVVEFQNITDKYYDTLAQIDNREFADVSIIRKKIEEALILKLFLLKLKNNKFIINIKFDNQIETISDATIPELNEYPFQIYSDITKKHYDFSLYYHFINDGKNSKKIYYCANARTVKEENDDDLNFSCELPRKTSFNMLLCSNYLDEMVNDSRDDFPEMSDKRQPNPICPLMYRDIKREMLIHMHKILIKQFPELEIMNKEQERIAIDKSPYLTKYIKLNDDLVKTEKSLTTKAINDFNKSKTNIQNKFIKALKNKGIDSQEFKDAVTEMSEVASAELGEYIHYRNNIIAALESSIKDEDKKESFIHNIFMPMRTESIGSDRDKHLLTNLWLLDDKYMTYTFCASDTSIKQLKNSLNKTYSNVFKDLNRPDLFIYFKGDNELDDMIIIEFKGANADIDEKRKAITELPDNISLIRQHFKLNENCQIYSYLITSLDKEFEFTIGNQDNYHKLFTNDTNHKAYYTYLHKLNTHEYIVDLETIVRDAYDRNNTFLEVLKQNY